MRVTLADGEDLDRTFCPANCIGSIFRGGSHVMLDARDLRIMRRLAESDPAMILYALLQLEKRFPENVVGGPRDGR